MATPISTESSRFNPSRHMVAFLRQDHVTPSVRLGKRDHGDTGLIEFDPPHSGLLGARPLDPIHQADDVHPQGGRPVVRDEQFGGPPRRVVVLAYPKERYGQGMRWKVFRRLTGTPIAKDLSLRHAEHLNAVFQAGGGSHRHVVHRNVVVAGGYALDPPAASAHEQ